MIAALRFGPDEYGQPPGVLQVFGVNDIETAELIARRVGKTDVNYITRPWSEGKNSSSEHISPSDLINADEIMRVPEGRMILLRQGSGRPGPRSFDITTTRKSQARMIRHE